MPKTPLRALRVPDELWRAAQARARDGGETVSEVVRRALSRYVATETSVSGVDTGFLLAQGMVMQRHGLGVDEAAAFLLRTSADAGEDLDATVRTFLDDHCKGQPGATTLA